MDDDTDDVRIVAIINKRIEPGTAMNALLHLGAGLINRLDSSERSRLKFIDFFDANHEVYPSISARSFIVLRGTGAEIAKVREGIYLNGLTAVSFIATMTGQTYVEQLERTRMIATSNIEFYGIAIFGTRSAIAPFTKKFSLWR
jgi:hypothetical protein